MEPQFSHDRLIQECFTWLWNTYPQTRRTCFHVPNELPKMANESKRAFAARLSRRKAIGVLPGVLDLIWYWRGCQHVLDAKMPGDRISQSQLDFIAANKAQGGSHLIFGTLQEFQDYINRYI